MNSSEVFVGIDVSKQRLDVATYPAQEEWAFANDGPGITSLVERLEGLHPAAVVSEATGGLHLPVAAALGGRWTPGSCGAPQAGQGLRQGHGEAGQN